MSNSFDFSSQIQKLYPVKKLNFYTDITETSVWRDDPFKPIMEAMQQKYDAFIQDCFLKCGFDEDYIFQHANEFSVRMIGQAINTQYFWKGNLIFSVLSEQKLTSSSNEFVRADCIVEYAAEFTGLRKEDL